MSEQDLQVTIQQTVDELFEQLDLQIQYTVNYDQESEYYTIQVDTDNPGLLIGYRGDTLGAIQYFLSQKLQKKTGDWVKISVNIGDYKERRQETLESLALNAAKRVQFSGEPYTFTGLTPPERRIVHMTLQDNPNITTESRGEGRQRQLVVLPKE